MDVRFDEPTQVGLVRVVLRAVRDGEGGNSAGDAASHEPNAYDGQRRPQQAEDSVSSKLTQSGQECQEPEAIALRFLQSAPHTRAGAALRGRLGESAHGCNILSNSCISEPKQKVVVFAARSLPRKIWETSRSWPLEGSLDGPWKVLLECA